MIQEHTCPHCTNSDKRMLELIWETAFAWYYMCAICSKSFSIKK